MEDGDFLKDKLTKLKADVKRLEDAIREDDFGHSKTYSVFTSALHKYNHLEDTDTPLTCHETRLRDFIELSSKASDFNLESFSRNLRLNPGEFYVYDCWIQGNTSSIKFQIKFCETVQGSGEECGMISEMEAEISMTKDDPETLIGWISTCSMAGDIPLFINGLVEFSNHAQIRRRILKSLCKRNQMGKLGSSSFRIQSVKDSGVLVIGVGPNGHNLFSITWKIGYCEPTKSMMSSFDVELHTQGEQVTSQDVFVALQEPFLKEEVLPQLWEAVAEALICCI